MRSGGTRSCSSHGRSHIRIHVLQVGESSIRPSSGLFRSFTVEGVVAGWMVAGASVPGQVSRSSEGGGSHSAYLEDFDVPDATFGCPDLTTFCPSVCCACTSCSAVGRRAADARPVPRLDSGHPAVCGAEQLPSARTGPAGWFGVAVATRTMLLFHLRRPVRIRGRRCRAGPGQLPHSPH